MAERAAARTQKAVEDAGGLATMVTALVSENGECGRSQ